MPTTTVEWVDRPESVFASFMEKTEEALADIRASTADIRASTAEIRASTAEIRADSMGTLIEDMVAPNARRIASEIFPADPVERLAQRVRLVHPSDRGRMMEVDLLAAGRQHLMIVEAKRRLNPETIHEFVEKAKAVPEFMTEYAGHKLVPVVASVTIEASAITFLNRQKVYGEAMGDETMELINLGQF